MAMRGETRNGSCTPHGTPASDLRLGDGEARVLGSDTEVAHHGDQEASRIRHAVHRRDRRLRDLDVAAEMGYEVCGRYPEGACSAISLRSPPAQNARSPAPVSTSTRAESSPLKRSRRIEEAGAHAFVQRVRRLGAVDRGPRDAAHHLVASRS